MSASPRRGAWLWAIAALALGAVGIALATQHLLGMEPCPWCILQRLIFVVIAALALLGLVVGPAPAALGVLAASLAGVAAALWQHFVAAASDSCKLTWAEKIISGLKLDAVLPEIFQPRASCADAAVKLLGLPYEFWSLGLFVLLGALALRLLRR